MNAGAYISEIFRHHCHHQAQVAAGRTAEAVAALDADPEVRVIVLAGKGKAFCAGIDLMDHAQGLGSGGSLTGGEGSAVAKRRQLYDDIRAYQDTCSSFANTNKPVIAAVHGACIGAGMDLITACDIRLASAEATFSVRETRIAMVADVGSPNVGLTNSWQKLTLSRTVVTNGGNLGLRVSQSGAVAGDAFYADAAVLGVMADQIAAEQGGYDERRLESIQVRAVTLLRLEGIKSLLRRLESREVGIGSRLGR